MGMGSYSHVDWDAYKSTVKSAPIDKVFTSTDLKDSLNPHGVMMRESRDSTDNPASTPIIVGLDVTGSMGSVAHHIATESLGILFNEILDRKPVTNPHLMFMGIGDVAAGDRAPLQVSQFEADNRIVKQLRDLWLEGRGGSNSSESYHLPWYFATMHTSIDSMIKRNKKGYLFTMGDEEVPGILTPEHIKRVCGDEVEKGYTAAELFEMASRTYNVYHIIIEQGSHCRGSNADRVVEQWNDFVGQHAIRLSDYTKLSEVITSIIQVNEGADVAAVTKSWSGDTSVVVSRAIKDLTVSGKGVGGVTRL